MTKTYRTTKIKWKERFWKKVDKGFVCWLWKAGCFTNGYGQFRVGDKKMRAHRVSYFLKNGEIPKGLIVRHTCDNPKCVNPNHLIAGTHKENSKDRDIRGRGLKGRKHNYGLKGEKNPASKLDIKTVGEIRFMWPIYSYRKLAKRFNVSASQIANIVKNRAWKQEGV